MSSCDEHGAEDDGSTGDCELECGRFGGGSAPARERKVYNPHDAPMLMVTCRFLNSPHSGVTALAFDI